MSVQLQLALPLFVAVAVLVLIALLRKYRKPEAVILCLAVTLFGVLAITAPNVSLGSSQQVSQITESEISSLVLAQRYIQGGQYAEAEKILEDLQQVNAEDPDIQLAMARCKLLQGDYAAAALAYGELGDGKDIKEEAEIARGLYTLTVPNYNALIAQLKEQGKNPADYGLTETELPKVNLSDARYTIEKRIDKALDDFEEEYGESIIDAADRALAISMEFSNFDSEGEYDSSKVSSGIKGLEKVFEEKENLKQNRHLRLALLKGYVLKEDFKKIAAMVDGYACAEELIIASDLYISGEVKQEDFSAEFANSDNELSKRVLAACKEALAASKGSLNKEDYTAYQGRVDSLQDQMGDPVAHNLKNQMLQMAEEGDPGMRSKNYLALARLEQSRGNKKQADAFISDALGSATISEDAEYREPMVNMLQIVQGSADSSEVKNIAAYAQQAMDNALPLGLESVGNTTMKEEFTTQLGQSVNESKARVNIGKIDISQFPTVTARVQIQSNKWTTLSELQKNLVVYDCGSNITDFRLEKLEFQKSRIILLCDVSGSMSGSVQNMKDAIIAFAEGMQPGEEVSVVGFDSYIQFVHPFSSDPAVVAGYADSIYAGGGTAMYDSLLECEQYLSADPTVNNIIIAMTDGQDGSYVTESGMRSELGAFTSKTGATVYTMGLGSVDTDYLEMVAMYGNGSFLYADDKEKLTAFYDFIHGQLRNQYILTFTAENTELNERKLELELKEETSRAEKIYYLVEPDDPNSSIGNVDESFTAVNVKKKVIGLSVRSLARTNTEQKAMLAGEQFNKDDKITVKLKGTLQYELQAKFVSDKLYEVTIPADIGSDTYTLEVTVGGDFFSMEDELTVYEPGQRVTYSVGGYQFEANSMRTAEDGTVILSGDVVMNNWLRFRGEVSFTDNTENVILHDNQGAYIPFSTSGTGLAKTMAELHLSMYLGPLGNVRLSKDSYDENKREEFFVDSVFLAGMVDAGMTTCKGITLALYPNMVEFRSFEMKLDLPLMEQLFPGLDKDENPFKAEGAVLINSLSIGIVGSLKYEDDTDVKVGSLPIRVSEASIKVDTLLENYDYALHLKFKKFLGMEGIGGSISYVGGRFNAFHVRADVEIPVVKTPVPVSLKSLGFGIEGFAQDTSDTELLEAILNKTFEVSFGLDVADATDLLPELADFLDIKDMPLLEVPGDGGKMSVQLKNFKWAFEAEVKLLGLIDVGKVELAIGNYDYKNELLGIYGAENCGLHAALSNGITLEADDLLLSLTAGGELDVGLPYTSVDSNNTGRFKWGWIDAEVKAETVIALFVNSRGELQFSLKIRHLFGVDIVNGEWPKFQFGGGVGK